MPPFQPEARPLVSTSMEVERFAADWSHCDQLSNFLARSLSVAQPDPYFFANLLSTILNEVLEAIFHHHGTGGEIQLGISADALGLVLDVVIPVDPVAFEFYTKIERNLNSSDPEELYLTRLQDLTLTDRAIGFYELASNYGAQIQFLEKSGDSIRLLIHVQIDETAHGRA